MQFLKGRKAIVSGGGSGIGRAVVEKLAAADMETALADLHIPSGLPAGTHPFTCNVSAAEDIDRLFTGVQEKLGTPDILVCSAGRGIHEKLTEGDPEKWRQVIDTNLLGALRMIRAFVPGMLAKGQGDVVLLSSVSAGQAYAYGGVYAATKSALEVVAETLRQEVMPNVRVTVVAPGVTDTPFFKNTISGFHTVEDIGYGAISAEAVADAVLYALDKPPGLSINQIVLRPTNQPF
ncbi:NADP-dependent 3-hydroxy acid dehydrogenase YdfG [Pontibacter ummariensis]|uniref:NADP-dependent 3-hydroxy acid dehydrogenase YdfG n=1 Tax=Pontibacter ummariensis TaxID=1610492 RepID=A0A239KHA9_9BACT|nr:SDR family NAD(P)-dependent oxidoreductase [Pontibacter ummariensis]PRY05732.1 NADP-dependent 3-hydroxy acid dehydrogenase YdfG [Pontibacter ummariensis]SNT17776.1 NADP-dependent 3-hydroxy acid dehydrogenase YdfG [Pontibacter ummariensis]